MSEERHASLPPDAATKAARGSSDGAIEIAIDEVEPAVDKPSAFRAEGKADGAKIDGAPSSQRVGEATLRSDAPPRAGEATKRTRAKVTLKIPDDEVARPQLTPSAPPAKVAEPVEAPMVPMTPMRIITISSPAVVVTPAPTPAPSPAALRPSVAPSSGVPSSASASSAAKPAPAPSSPDDSWTPYQPTVADRTPSFHPPVAVPRPARPSAAPPASQARGSYPGAAGHASPPGPIPVAPPTAPMPPAPPTQPNRRSSDSLDDIPIVTDDAPPSSGEIELDDDARPTKPGSVSEPDVIPPKGTVDKVAATPAKADGVSAPAAGTPAPAPVALSALGTANTSVAVGATSSSLTTAASAAAAATARPLDSLGAPAVAPASPAAPIAPSPPRVVSIPPSAASQPQVSIKDLPPMRSLAPTEPEGLEVNFEDEEPPISSPRPSEPEAEIAAEDLVSVESVPGVLKAAAVPVVAAAETPARTSIPGSPPLATAASASGASGAAARNVSPPTPAAKGGAAAAKTSARVIVPTSSPLAPPPMSEAAPTGRRKARPWWEELFNDDFIRTMGKVSDAQIAKEVDFVEESLAVAKGAMLLDLACGTGRHAIELTRRGYKVVGFDLSLPMLAKAAEEAQERSQKLNFVQGDMREMTFEDTFDGIYCWNTSFGFFEEEKNAQVIQRVHKALKKGGQFMLEVGNRDYIIRQAPSLAWFEGDGCICMDEMSIDWITSRMKVKRTMMMDDGRTKEIDYSVRIYSLHELGKVLHDAGFRVAEVSGRTGTPGVYFGSESPRTMILAEKK